MTMNMDFQSSAWQLKMSRARYLRAELEAIFIQYRTSNPIEIIDSDWDGVTMKVELHVRNSPDPSWGTIVGDIVHNYHSTLDSLYFALITHFAAKIQKPLTRWDQEHISFPIFDTPKSFADKTKEVKKYGAIQILKDLEYYQPFEYLSEYIEEEDAEHVLAGHPLKILRDLSNTDKHRSLHIIHFYLYTHAIGLPSGVTLKAASKPLYFPSQTKYSLSFDFKGASLDRKPDFVPHFNLGVISGIGAPYTSDILDLLQAIEGKISFIIHQLEYHFKPGFGA